MPVEIDASAGSFDHHQLDFGNCLGGIEPLGTNVRAVHDSVAAIEAEWIFKGIEPLAGHLVPAVREPAIRL